MRILIDLNKSTVDKVEQRAALERRSRKQMIEMLVEKSIEN